MEIAHPEVDDGVPAAPNATETSSGDGVRSAGPSVWHKAERENARRALLQHGLERWREVRDRMYRDRDDGSTRTPAPSPSKPAGLGGSKRDVDDIAHLGFDFLRAVHATVAQRARSGARDARDARDLRTLESWARDRLRAASVGSVDRFVPDPLGVIGEWSKLERNAVPWARRLMTLDAVNLASERALAEETRDAAAATLEASLGEERCGEEKDLCANDGDADAKGVAAGKDRGKERAREMPDWWDANCDAWLLRGCGLYGAFAVTSWDDVREDAACSAAFRDAAARRGEDVRRRFLRSLEEARARSEANEARGFTRRAGGDSVTDGDAGPNPTEARETSASGPKRRDAFEHDPCAWPSYETLSARTKRLAEVLGAPDATPPPADPPWVAAKLGRPRARKRVFEKFAPADLALAAARASCEARKKRREARHDAARRDARRVVDAMNRLAWTELAAAEGDAPVRADDASSASGEASLRAARARVSDWTKADLMRLLRGVTAHGLPWRADAPGAPDWHALARASKLAAPRSVPQTRAAFHALAVEMALILDMTGGKARRAVDTSDHDVRTCRCFVCGSKRQKQDAEGDSETLAAATRAASPAAPSGAVGSDAEDADDDADDDDADDDDDAFEIRPIPIRSDRSDRGTEPSPSQKPRQQLRPFGLLTAVYATRAAASLETLQTLRRAAATRRRGPGQKKNAFAVTDLPLPNMKTKDLPDWWDERTHFPALVQGVLKHGTANLDAVGDDPALPFANGERAGTPGEALPPPRVCLRVLGIAARLYKRTILRDVL